MLQRGLPSRRQRLLRGGPARRRAAARVRAAADVVALYTEDAIVLPPGLAPVIGHEAIQDWFTTAFGLGITWIELMTDMVVGLMLLVMKPPAGRLTRPRTIRLRRP